MLIGSLNARLSENMVNPLILPCVTVAPEIVMVNMVISVTESEVYANPPHTFTCNLYVMNEHNNYYTLILNYTSKPTGRTGY